MVRGFLGLGTTFVLAMVSAMVFLVLRCQGEGRTFGPSSRWWALAAITLTSATSTVGAFAGVLLMRYVPPALVGVVVPSGLWLGHIKRPRVEDRRSRTVEVPTLGLSILLDRLHQGMAEDRLTWCEDRIDQMWPLDWLQAAARYYHARIKERVPPEERRRVKIDARLRAIEDRLDAAITIENGASATRVRVALRGSRITNEKRYERYQHDFGRLAELLRHDAEQDLIRLLGVGYKLGCYQLAVFRAPTREPSLSKPRPHP